MLRRSSQVRIHIAEAVLAGIAIIASGIMLSVVITEGRSVLGVVIWGAVIAASLISLIWLWLNPDRIRADQSNAVLTLASRMLAAMDNGLDLQSAQKICEVLLPETNAIAVAITDTENILGYAGEGEEYNTLGTPIRTVATRATVSDGVLRVLYSSSDIGFPEDHHTINGAILVPLSVGGKTVGTLKFYFRRPRNINATQQSIAAGFGELLSTQLAAVALEEQKKLATSMELKALQAQINPHFLFNTLNTISSFTRTDPDRARLLLREFSKFYRGVLESSSDLIPLQQEFDQTARYLQFEIARFGEDRLRLTEDVPEELASSLVPAFLIQPLVENAVKHAMPMEGTLTISVRAFAEGKDLILTIVDNGVGMSEDKLAHIMNSESSTGLGIAVSNIRDRVQSYYGDGSYMKVESEVGVGTSITLFLKNGYTTEALNDTLAVSTGTSEQNALKTSFHGRAITPANETDEGASLRPNLPSSGFTGKRIGL